VYSTIALLFFFLVPCVRLKADTHYPYVRPVSWVFVSFWGHVNIFRRNRIVSYRIVLISTMSTRDARDVLSTSDVTVQPFKVTRKGTARALRAYIAVSPQIHCNPSSCTSSHQLCRLLQRSALSSSITHHWLPCSLLEMTLSTDINSGQRSALKRHADQWRVCVRVFSLTHINSWTDLNNLYVSTHGSALWDHDKAGYHFLRIIHKKNSILGPFGGMNRHFQAKLAKYKHLHIIKTTASIPTTFIQS